MPSEIPTPLAFEKTAILQALERLDQRWRRPTRFGRRPARVFYLDPPVPLAAVEAFEKKYDVALPDDYKYFVTQIGNGVARGGGVFPFGEECFRDEPRKFEESDFLAEISQPFPHTEAWNLPDSFWDQKPKPPRDAPPEEKERIWQEWAPIEGAAYWKPGLLNGAIPIQDLGCGSSRWLVVNGPQKGAVWDDRRVDRGGIVPLCDEQGRQMTFADWYLSWFKSTDDFLSRLSRHRMARSCLPLLAAGTFHALAILLGTYLGIVVADHFRPISPPAALVCILTGYLVTLGLLVLIRHGLKRSFRRSRGEASEETRH